LGHLNKQDFHTLSSNHFRPFLFDNVIGDPVNKNGGLLYCDLMIFNAIRHHQHHRVF